MRKMLIALAGGALVVTLAVPAGASVAAPQRGGPGPIPAAHGGGGGSHFGGDRGGDHGGRGGDRWGRGDHGYPDPRGGDHRGDYRGRYPGDRNCYYGPYYDWRDCRR